jgi:hypothetical protein
MTVVTILTACFNNITLCGLSIFSYDVQNTRPLPGTLSAGYTIIVPTKCTSLLKAQDITICTFVFVFIAPTCFSPRGPSSGGAMPVPS